MYKLRLFLFALFLFVGGSLLPTIARADTFCTYGWYDHSYICDGAYSNLSPADCPTGDGYEIGQICAHQFTVNLDKGTYDAGETMTTTGSVRTSQCSNEGGFLGDGALTNEEVALQGTVVGSGDGEPRIYYGTPALRPSGPNPWGSPSYFTKTFTAPSVGGDYTFRFRARSAGISFYRPSLIMPSLPGGAIYVSQELYESNPDYWGWYMWHHASVPQNVTHDIGFSVRPPLVKEWETYCTETNGNSANHWQWWRKTTNTNPVEYEFVRSGDGSCVAPTVQPPAKPTGTLSISPAGSCTIASGQSTCRATLTWTTQNAESSVVQGAGPNWPSGTTLINTINTSGTVPVDLYPGAHIFNVSGSVGGVWHGPLASLNYTVNPAPPPPTAVDNPVVSVTCDADGKGATLSWSQVSGATDYYPRVQRGLAPGCPTGWTSWNGTGAGRGCYIGDVNNNTNAGIGNTTSIHFSGLTPGATSQAWVHTKVGGVINTGIVPAGGAAFTCAALVTGACGTTANTCTAGTPISGTDTADEEKWTCSGQNGGSPSGTCSAPIPGTWNTICTEGVDINGNDWEWWDYFSPNSDLSLKTGWRFNRSGDGTCRPAPPTVTKQCDTNGQAVTISWTTPPGADTTKFHPRITGVTEQQCKNSGWEWNLVTSGTNTWYECRPRNDGDWAQNTARFPVTPGVQTNFWVHAQATRSAWGDAGGTGAFTCTTPLTASCSVDPVTITAGGTATWTATVSGGTGTYTYAWTGTDILSGTTGASFSKQYTTAGPKTASVTVTAGSESKTVTCTNTLTVAALPNLTSTAFTVQGGSTHTMGATLSLSARPKNSGGSTVSTPYIDRFYFQPANRTPAAAWVKISEQLGTVPLEAGVSGAVEKTSLSFATAGTYNLYHCVDQMNTIPNESNEDDNCSMTVVTIQPPPNKLPAGNFDSVTCSSVSGWAVDPDSTASLIDVHVWEHFAPGSGKDPIPVAAGKTSILRNDVNAERTGIAGLVAGNHGFAFATPENLKNNGRHTLKAFGIDANNGQPKQVGGDKVIDLTCTTPIVGVCGTGNNQCISGTSVDTPPDTVTQYQWTCNGLYGGAPSGTCSAPKTPNLTASCSVDPVTITAGGTATWTATVSGGTGTYTYAWTGTDILSGTTGASFSKQYTTAGPKTASVTVTAGSESKTVTCTNMLTVQDLPNLTTTLSIEGGTSHKSSDLVTLKALVTNAGAGVVSAPYTDTFYYNLASFPADQKGTALPSIPGKPLSAGGTTLESYTLSFLTPGSYRITHCADTANQITESSESDNCATTTITVTAPPQLPSVTCAPHAASVMVDSPVTWTATPTGGTPDYTYTWRIDGSSADTTQVVNKTYSSAGRKEAFVTVEDDLGLSSGEAMCSATIREEDTPVPSDPPTATLEISPRGQNAWSGSDLTIDLALGLGQTLDLKWSSTNATRCVGDSYFRTEGMRSGTVTGLTPPLSSPYTRTYDVICYNSENESARDSVKVLVRPVLGTPDISVNPERLRQGETTQVTIDRGGRTGCSVSAPGQPTKNDIADGVYTSDPINGETTFTLSCASGGGTDTALVRLYPKIEEI